MFAFARQLSQKAFLTCLRRIESHFINWMHNLGAATSLCLHRHSLLGCRFSMRAVQRLPALAGRICSLTHRNPEHWNGLEHLQIKDGQMKHNLLYASNSFRQQTCRSAMLDWLVIYVILQVSSDMHQAEKLLRALVVSPGLRRILVARQMPKIFLPDACGRNLQYRTGYRVPSFFSGCSNIFGKG